MQLTIKLKKRNLMLLVFLLCTLFFVRGAFAQNSSFEEPVLFNPPGFNSSLYAAVQYEIPQEMFDQMFAKFETRFETIESKTDSRTIFDYLSVINLVLIIIIFILIIKKKKMNPPIRSSDIK